MSAVASPERKTAKPELSGPVLGMVLFVASEAMFFAAFFAAFFTIKDNEPTWPPPGIHLENRVATILTVILIVSSVTVQVALRSMRSGASRRATVWLGITIALGITFLALQLYDYSQLGFGLKDGPFGTLFYVMTGLHMAHVFGGVVFLALVFSQVLRGRLSPEHHDPMSAGAIYWDFVDVVWICLFIVFYILTPR